MLHAFPLADRERFILQDTLEKVFQLTNFVANSKIIVGN